LKAIIQKIERGQKLDSNAIFNLIATTEPIFESEPQLIEIQTKITKNLEGIVFVGDTHGDFSSTFAVFREFDPKKYLIVLLGDYIDRGPFSARNINYILAQKLMHEKNVIVLRGNHETPLINFRHGFFDELSKKYPKRAFELYEFYNKLFSFIPYSTLVENSILALHGGLAFSLKTYKDIKNIRKGDLLPEDPIAFQILWNDPNEEILDKSFLKSGRGGNCFYFGKKVVTDFLIRNGLSYIIRAHGPQKEGYSFYFKDLEEYRLKRKLLQNSQSIPNPISGFDGRLLSLHSCRTAIVRDPKIALISNEKLNIISLTTICKSRGIKSGKIPIWERQTSLRGGGSPI